MIYLLKSELISQHSEIILETGGLPGIKDSFRLGSIIERPKNDYLFGDIFLKASSYAEAITQWHPFNDGNKRVGFSAAVTFLEYNGYRFQINDNIVSTVLKLTTKQISLEEFSDWLKANSKLIIKL